MMKNTKVSIRHQQKKTKTFLLSTFKHCDKKPLRQTENNFVNFYNVVVVCVVCVVYVCYHFKKKKKKMIDVVARYSNVEKIHQTFTNGLLMLKVCTDTDLKWNCVWKMSDLCLINLNYHNYYNFLFHREPVEELFVLWLFSFLLCMINKLEKKMNIASASLSCWQKTEMLIRGQTIYYYCC